MKNKFNNKKILFSFLLVFIGLFFINSGYFEITKNTATYPKTIQMGYPPFFILTLGIAKILGVLALWQKKINWLRDWAFAGFTFDTIFAFISGWAVYSYIDCLKAAILIVLVLFTFFLNRSIKTTV